MPHPEIGLDLGRKGRKQIGIEDFFRAGFFKDGRLGGNTVDFRFVRLVKMDPLHRFIFVKVTDIGKSLFIPVSGIQVNGKAGLLHESKQLGIRRRGRSQIDLPDAIPRRAQKERGDPGFLQQLYLLR